MTKTFPEITKNLPEFDIFYKHGGKKSLPKESTYHEFWALADAKIKDYVNIIARDLKCGNNHPSQNETLQTWRGSSMTETR